MRRWRRWFGARRWPRVLVEWAEVDVAGGWHSYFQMFDDIWVAAVDNVVVGMHGKWETVPILDVLILDRLTMDYETEIDRVMIGGVR
jgi:hypothetical protein